jgi:hypothetical protein
MKMTSNILTSVAVIALVIQLLTLDSSNFIITTAQNETDVFTVIPAIYGINNTTNEIVVIVSTEDWTMTRVVNASLVDHMDTSHDGIIELGIRFANKTVPIGQEFRACVIIAADLNLICKTGHNSPSVRPETIDLLLTSRNSSMGNESLNGTELSYNK